MSGTHHYGVVDAAPTIDFDATPVEGSRRRGRHGLAWSALLLSAALTVSACQSVTPDAAADTKTATPSSTTITAAPVSLTITPADGATSVRPDTKVTVSASGGTISKVSLATSKGDEVQGSLNDDKTLWTAAASLRPKSTYEVTATGVNADGVPTTTTASLKTLTPKDSANYDIIPSSSGPVGVGMPVVIQFVTAVDKDKRADVERRASVTSTPAMDGAWGWLDGRQLIWRPATYWKPGTKVTVTADIAGIETKKGLWTTRNAKHTFSIGAAMVSTVNTKTHRMTVTRNGKVLRVLKVSTGRPGSDTETRNGVKIILSRESEHVMDSATIGIQKGEAGYYRTLTKWAMRLTWSGEFLHSAPWSVGSQGNANVSHGCTNLSPSDAKWLFDRSSMGDVVKFVGSSRHLEEYNGYTMWNQSLAQWAKHSAL